MIVGLRIDVDTLRGTMSGVPNLNRLFAEHSIKASFFFSVGPDNMGRHLFRLFRPSFLIKMLRSNAPNLYGWDIIFKGTLWPGPVIGKKSGDIIRQTSDEGHEAGFHAWDHHGWQAKIDRMATEDIYASLDKGVGLLAGITGKTPVSSAAPAWKCNDLVLMEKERFPFTYNSDCRGESIFFPVVGKRQLSQPQIPVTLPTYDEVIGRNGLTDHNYNEYLLSLLKPGKLNVLTVHAEVEGIAYVDMFGRFLKAAISKGVLFVPLGDLLSMNLPIGRAKIVPKKIEGRDGWIACQEPI